MEKKTALIIGAGPAGLTAGYEFLTKSDVHPIILEAENFVGGISRTVNYKGNRMDIGGHRFFSKDEKVVEIWKHFLPVQGQPAKDDLVLNRYKPLVEKGPDPEKVDETMLIRDRISRILFLRKFFDYPISLKFSTFKNMGFKRTMKAGFGYIGSCFHKRKEDNLENFYINRFGKPLYSMFFEDYTEKVWGVHPSNISADWGAQRVKGLSIWKAIKNALAKPFRKKNSKVETSLIEQFMYPKKGPGQLYETMAEDILARGGEIIKNQTVVKINLEDGKIKSVIAENEKGEQTEYTADYYISSMPIKDLLVAIGQENSPLEVYDTAVNLPYRDFITVGLLLDKLKVENKTKIKTINNIVPDCWIYVQEKDVKLGRIQIFNNWSPYMVSDEDKIWIGLEYFCNEGDEAWTCPDDEFIKKAIDELVKINVIESSENVFDSTIVHVKKAYPAYFGTYENFDVVKNYLNEIDNLYCVGRNGQHRYNNMDHSMATAMVCVDAILNGKDKSELWDVNTEKEYHEEKDKKEEKKEKGKKND